ncbi:hypothetical protein LCGC14_1346770 [marine sediment metagenome]|uniref:Ribbon-helix-helix protein CopG domain-containing protein n=1 Tax=marine sediment metagenome TaxID=412755 RepID=A0A0F9KCN5_9ZZZZ
MKTPDVAEAVKTINRERLSLTMDPTILRRLDKMAKAEYRGRSSAIDILIKEALDAREEQSAPTGG